MRFILLSFVTTALLFLLPSVGSAQQEQSMQPSLKESFRIASQLFEEEKYGNAIHLFESIFEKSEQKSSLSVQSAYYIAACNFEMGLPNGSDDLKKFITDYPQSVLLDASRFRLANHDLQNKKFKEALRQYQKINKRSLSKDEREKLIFNTSMAFLGTGDNIRAKSGFNQLRAKPTSTGDASKYYWAHISYIDGKWDDALLELKKLENISPYNKTIPYYLVQIAFAKEEYDQVISQAIPLLEKGEPERKFELARVLIVSYYQTGQYENALPLIKMYFLKGEIPREDCFVAAFCFEKNGEKDEAIRWYEKCIGKSDATAQHASHRLGALYMNKGDKPKGMQSFKNASDMRFDAKIREDALFQYAKATYELDYSPFNESIKAFDKFISEYPNSEMNDTAYDYLVKVFMTTHNFKDALSSLEKIKKKSPAIQKAYQRVALYRGIEFFRDLDFTRAEAHFTIAIQQQTSSPSIKALAVYWKAEALYRLNKPEESQRNYLIFQSMPESKKMKELSTSYYNIGYIHFNKNELAAASSDFQKFILLNKDAESQLIGDVYNRLGDCRFAERNYQEALLNYRLSYNLASSDPDYALFQIAFTEGIMQNQELKLQDLSKLLANYPESPFRDDALFESGKAWERLSNSTNAENSYQELLTRYTTSTLVPKALLQLGLLAYNQNKFDESLGYYKQVMERFPESDEAKGALTGIKNNYLEKNDVDEFVAYTKNLGNAAPTISEQDSLSYFSAEKLYMAKDPGAITQLSKYISNFPQGNFILNARYYRGEVSVREGLDSQALQDFDYVLTNPDNLFTDNSLLKAAGLAFDQKEFSKSLEYFKRLGLRSADHAGQIMAMTGEMRCYYELQSWDQVAKIGWKIRSSGKIPQEIDRESSYKSAKAYEAMNDPAKALQLWRKLSADPKSREGAEAKYQLCKYYFDNNRLKDAENEVMNFIDKNSPHKQWLGKSFLILARVYNRMDDNFQAINTLKSVIENYENKDDGIIDEANQLLKEYQKK